MVPVVTPRLRLLPTAALTSGELRAVRALMDAAFGTGEEAFADDDWAHALGGQHFVLDEDGEILSHASVVERVLEIGGRPLRTGYVEAVATDPGAQGRGHGSAVMAAATEHIRAMFELGVLGTGRHAFYERLGWGDLAGLGIRPDAGWGAADPRRRGLHPRPAHAGLAAVRARRADQLRLASRRRVVAESSA